MIFRGILIFSMGCSWGFAEQDPVSPGEVEQWVTLLASPNYRDRDAAQKHLQQLGSRAIIPLKASLKQATNTEVQRRLEVLVEHLEHERLVAPSRVSINVKSAPVDEVIREIARQAGYRTNDGMPKDKRVTIELKDVPFWEAIQKVSNATGIYVNIQDDDEVNLYAYNNESVSPFTQPSGPFLFVASSINSSKNIQLANLPTRIQSSHQQQEYLGLSVQVLAEPKCPILNVQQAIVTKAFDDKGMSLIPQNSNDNILTESRYYNHYVYRSFNQSFGVNLTRGDRGARMIQELKGKVTMTVLKEVRPEITVDKVLEAAKKKFTGNSVELEISEVTEAGGTLTVGLIFRQKNPNPQDYNWYNSLYQRLVVLDESGNKLLKNGIQDQRVGVGVMNMKMIFAPKNTNKSSKPAKLILHEWVSCPQTFEFEFKDIPLP